MPRPTWDHPDADPMADLMDFMTMGWHMHAEPVLIIPARTYDLITTLLGHPPTPADLPPGTPGRWMAIVRQEPFYAPPA